MRILISTALTAVLASYSSVYALSVTNHDGTDQKLIIIEGEKQREETVAPNKTLSNICPAGCVIQLENGEEYEFDGQEVVSIEEGLMFLDEPAQEDSSGSATPESQGESPGAQTPPAPSGQTPAQAPEK
jgi:hypothetical protein